MNGIYVEIPLLAAIGGIVFIIVVSALLMSQKMRNVKLKKLNFGNTGRHCSGQQ
jgi:hypothetical protein